MRRVRRPLLALIVLLVALAVGYTVRAVDRPSPSVPTVSMKNLPLHVAETVHRIEDGGPFRSLGELASRAGAGRPSRDKRAWAGACDSLVERAAG